MASYARRLLCYFLAFLAFLGSFGCYGDNDPPGMDRATVEVVNYLSEAVDVSTKSDNCYKCLDSFQGNVTEHSNETFIADTTYGITFYINLTETHEFLFSVHQHLQEGASYQLTIEGNDHMLVLTNVTCQFVKNKDGINSYLPLLYAAVAILVISVAGILCYVAYRYILERCYFNSVDRVTARDLGMPKTNPGIMTRNGTFAKTSTSLNASPLTQGTAEGSTITPTSPSTPDHTHAMPPDERTPLINPRLTVAAPRDGAEKKKDRLTSLDTFRGFSLIIMVFVNYGGGGYYFFNHSRWNGLTVADLVFPWFVWIMGVSVVFSFKSRRRESFLARLYQVVRRSIILFGLGLFLNNGYHLSSWRIPGVLQRFGITYFVVALTELLTLELYSRCDHKQWFRWAPVADLTHCWVQWLLVLLLEVLWLALTFLLPPSGHNCPRGYLGPGGISEWGAYRNCTGGAAHTIDLWLFTEHHIYQSPTAKELYQLEVPFDPEGALGTLNSVVICFLGVQAGRTLTAFRGRHAAVLFRFALWGVLLSVLGTALCEGAKNGGAIPLNKNLWSLSFILVMAGGGYLLLGLCYLLVDVLHLWNGVPFKYPGMNSILVYVGSEVLGSYFPFSWDGQHESHLRLLSANLVAVAIWMLISYYWHWIGFFVKI